MFWVCQPCSLLMEILAEFLCVLILADCCVDEYSNLGIIVDLGSLFSNVNRLLVFP
jgi:hypothetical protein